MGYTTDFTGKFDLDKTLRPEHAAYLKAFAKTRRMKRNPEIADKMSDPVRLAVGLPIGPEGAYFVGSTADHGQVKDASVAAYNDAPSGQPGLWCQWVPTEDGNGIEWDQGEKFYDYTKWLAYLIENFLKPWGYVLNGKVNWLGEDSQDQGTIFVRRNRVQAVEARITVPQPAWEDE